MNVKTLPSVQCYACDLMTPYKRVLIEWLIGPLCQIVNPWLCIAQSLSLLSFLMFLVEKFFFWFYVFLFIDCIYMILY